MLDAFWRNGVYGLRPRCKDCMSSPQELKRRREREYAWAEKNRENLNRWRREYRLRNYDKFREKELRQAASPQAQASKAVREAVRAGKLTKSEFCEDCGARGRLHGHHTDYSKVFEVEWLCSRCHGRCHSLDESPGARA